MSNGNKITRVAAGLARRSVAGASDSPRRQIGEQARPLHVPGHRLRRGFSFVELLFAIMILGIGFILIAAIFPVAIRQTQASGEETVAATIAKSAVADIQQFASNATMPATSYKVVPIGPTTPTGETAATALWTAINGNMILPSDNRYAWAAMYERDSATTPYAQVIIIGMQVRNRTQYTPADASFYAPSPNTDNYPAQPNLQPKQVYVQFAYGSGAPDTVTFLTTNAPSSSATPELYNAAAVAEGCYLIISDDNGNHTSNAYYPNATCNGQTYRVGNFVSSTATTSTWQLIPGSDLASQTSNVVQPVASKTINALIVGRSIHDPTITTGYDSTANPYEGLAQDISVYVGFVRINS